MTSAAVAQTWLFETRGGSVPASCCGTGAWSCWIQLQVVIGIIDEKRTLGLAPFYIFFPMILYPSSWSPETPAFRVQNRSTSISSLPFSTITFISSFQSGLLILAMFHSLDTWLCLEQRGYHLQGCDMLLVRFEFWGQVASGSPFTAALMPLRADLALARILIRSPFTAPCPFGPINAAFMVFSPS